MIDRAPRESLSRIGQDGGRGGSYPEDQCRKLEI